MLFRSLNGTDHTSVVLGKGQRSESYEIQRPDTSCEELEVEREHVREHLGLTDGLLNHSIHCSSVIHPPKKLKPRHPVLLCWPEHI